MVPKEPQIWIPSRAAKIITLTVLISLAGNLVLNPIAGALALWIDAAAGLLLALGVTMGPWVAIGAGIGTVLAEVVTGTFGSYSAVSYASTYLFIYTGVIFWNSFDNKSILKAKIATAGQFVLVSIPATLATTAIQSWGAELFSWAPFAAVFPTKFSGTLLGVIFAGLPTLFGIQILITRTSLIDETISDSKPTFGDRQVAGAIVVILFFWGALGVVMSLVFQPLQIEFAQRIANRAGWTGQTIISLAGGGGRNFQILLGIVAFICLLFCSKNIEKCPDSN